MTKPVSKLSQIELKRFLEKVTSSTRYGQEDLMERAADLLEEAWPRQFVTTVCGFARLVNLVQEHQIKEINTWLSWRFPNCEHMIKPLVELSLNKPNLNITLKRMTAILTKDERLTIAQGILDIIKNDAEVVEEKHELVIKNILEKLLLSKDLAENLMKPKKYTRL